MREGGGEKKRCGISSTQFNHEITSGDEKRFNESAEHVSDSHGGHERVRMKRDRKSSAVARDQIKTNIITREKGKGLNIWLFICWVILSCGHAVFFFSLTSRTGSPVCPLLMPWSRLWSSQGGEVGLRVGRFTTGGSL